MRSTSERVVLLGADLYPASAVRSALAAFQNQVDAEATGGGASRAGADLALTLRPRPGAPSAAVDDLLDAMLRVALDVHLRRNPNEPRLPRGL